jgi:tryptophanyl-tRNA synthetase
MLPHRCIRRCGSSTIYNIHRSWLAKAAPRCLSTESKSPTPKAIFSGIQPTGVPHLGNYLGALQRWVELQNEATPDTTLIYSLVDLHAITIRQDPAQLRKWKNESFAMLQAVGLDPRRSIIFHQSAVPAHTELMWILSCQASTGYLSRMTQWKEKAAGERENSEKLKLGLFSYPVLQAADVLVHRATHVPVGHDQAQHLEFAREVANGFNHIYGEGVLVPPDTLISPAKRIMSLTDAKVKMSKSHPNPKSRILLTDSEEEIRSKIKTAITDSQDGITYDPENRPGISNLLDILYHTSRKGQYDNIEDLVREMEGVSFKVFKDLVAANVEATVRPIRERYRELVGQEDFLFGVALAGAEKAASSAEATLMGVKQAVGLL